MDRLWIGLLVGGGSGGVLGYTLRAWIDDQFAQIGEHRTSRRDDTAAQRSALLEFLGPPRAHFTWLQDVAPSRLNTGEPPLAEKVKMIETWVNENRPRFPEQIQRHFNLILTCVSPFGRLGKAKQSQAFEARRQALEVWPESNDSSTCQSPACLPPNIVGPCANFLSGTGPTLSMAVENVALVAIENVTPGWG